MKIEGKHCSPWQRSVTVSVCRPQSGLKHKAGRVWRQKDWASTDHLQELRVECIHVNFELFHLLNIWFKELQLWKITYNFHSFPRTRSIHWSFLWSRLCVKVKKRGNTDHHTGMTYHADLKNQHKKYLVWHRKYLRMLIFATCQNRCMYTDTYRWSSIYISLT